LATSCRLAYRVQQHAHTGQLTTSLRHQSLHANHRQIACFSMILSIFCGAAAQRESCPPHTRGI
jgi:hypothetical protein